MGNSKSSACGIPLCGGDDYSGRKKNLRGQRRETNFLKALEAKNSLKQMLEEDTFQRFEHIKVSTADIHALQYDSPIDDCFKYLEEKLINSKSEWATSLLYNYAGLIGDLMERKYKTYNWNIEVNLQEEAIRFEAIKEYISDSMKERSLEQAGEN